MANKMTNDQIKQMCKKAKNLGFKSDRLILLDERLTEWVKSEITPSIAVKVLRHGQVAFEGAYGIQGPDKEPDSLTTDTIFPMCSITKPIVSTLLSIMQEEGLIDLNHPVRKYIPEFTGDTNNSVRICHLLTHTSGLIDSDLDKHFDDLVISILGRTIIKDESEETLNEIYVKIREKMGLPYIEPSREMRQNTYMAVRYATPPTHYPQNQMAYCNTGYHLAMDIVKRVSGMKIDDYAGHKLFRPLKMSDSHFIFPREKISRYVARADDFTGSNWLNEGVLNSESGPGGLKSTVHDMTRFGQMFLNHGTLDGVRVLSKASVREMTSDQNAKLPPAVYNGEIFDSTWGLGWNIRGCKKDDCGMLRSPKSFEHGGFGSCKLLCDPEADVVAAFFTVNKNDDYWNAAFFNNIVLGSIDD